MNRRGIRFTVLTALCVIAAVGADWVSRRVMATAHAQAGARGLPLFEVDRAWPKVPAQWRLGDVSSFAIDARDNVWLLHRPPGAEA